MKTKYYLIYVFILLTGCAPSPTPLDLPSDIKAEDMVIETQHYSIALNSAERWKIAKIIEKYDGIILNRDKQPPFCRIMVIKKRVDQDAIEGQSAREMAFYIRNREKQEMIAFGVDKGLYQLREVAMAEEVIGEKIFYSMNYKTIPAQEWGYEKAGLYLYFPKESDNEYYIVAHFSQTYLNESPSDQSCRPDFVSILESLQIKSQGEN
jgi:hypothetical protein